VRLPKLRRGAPAADEAGAPRRRRRAPRPGGPRTIIPLDDAAPARPPAAFALDVDAARERLRRVIPPVGDDLE
jgi:hypothetical protein